ncbi:MAG: DUF4391 domain-containing protein [Oscillospiraceae bacterium]|nr:DUF4391 domain-containing protein [Oscillospiraceae bacterium]
MLNLPKSTEMNKQLPKKAIYAKFQMTPTARTKFDTDISRINIVGEISPNTISIPQGQTVSSIFVLQVILKQRNFQQSTISQISKLIDQNMLLILDYNNERKLAIYHSKLIQTEWVPADICTIEFKGLDLDTVWENLITQIGGITIQQGKTLDEQIAADEQQAKQEKEITRLEKLARAEKQPKRKFELVQQINKMKG